MAFFGLNSPRDMLEKARRDHERMKQVLSTDNIFNFFVAANHIRDFRETKAVPQPLLDAFSQDHDIRDCADMCNTGKHLRLDYRPTPQTDVNFGGAFNEAAFGEAPFGGGGPALISSGRVVYVDDLARRVMQKWDAVFAQHGL